MATTSPAAAPFQSPPARRTNTNVSGRGRSRFVTITVLAAVVFAGASGLLAWKKHRDAANAQEGAEIQRVQKGRLLVTVSADGNVESASNRELKCQVAGGGRIIWIIPDGTQVAKGAEVVQLDRSTF